MTRLEFIARAIKEHERRLQLPAGWWGSWTDFTNGKARIKRGKAHGVWGWKLSMNGVDVSNHDSRSGAIAKAKAMVKR